MNSFHELGISEPLLGTLSEIGFTEPTEIQQKAIPFLLKSDRDFIGLAQTGTGKTAAFSLPVIEKIDPDKPEIQALILTPTRELGQQVAEQIKSFSKAVKDLNVEVVYGGANIVGQIKALKRKTQILVATPGRLIDLINRKALSIQNISYLILDEADEMLNMGFQEDVDKILSFTKGNARIWLFSATMPAEIKRISKNYMKEPEEVSVNQTAKVNQNIAHHYLYLKQSDRQSALLRILDFEPGLRGLVFCRTRLDTQELADRLIQKGYSADALHGDMSQAQRDRVMNRFRNGSLKVLIATDVAARGIDVDDLSHVIHYSLPENQEYYTHRAGRTARAGKLGISLAFATGKSKSMIKDLERKLKLKFTPYHFPSSSEIKKARVLKWAEKVAEEKREKVGQELLEEALNRLNGMSKEEIVAALVAREISEVEDHSEISIKDISDKPSNKSNGAFTRMFINIGSIDNFTKGDLLKFIESNAGVKGDKIGDIRMQKNHSFFDLENDTVSLLEKKFRDKKLDGRSLRVNKDQEGENRKKKKRKGRS